MDENNKYKLTKLDKEKWVQNTLTFFLPVLVIYLLYVQSNLINDGFTKEAFIPNELVAGAMSLYIINTLIDLIKKFLSNTK